MKNYQNNGPTVLKFPYASLHNMQAKNIFSNFELHIANYKLLSYLSYEKK